jgi:hypothetical protein
LAPLAGPAADLKRDHDPLAELDRPDLVADCDHLGDALMPEVEGQGEWRRPEAKGSIEVAGGRSDRADDGR